MEKYQCLLSSHQEWRQQHQPGTVREWHEITQDTVTPLRHGLGVPVWPATLHNACGPQPGSLGLPHHPHHPAAAPCLPWPRPNPLHYCPALERLHEWTQGKAQLRVRGELSRVIIQQREVWLRNRKHVSRLPGRRCEALSMFVSLYVPFPHTSSRIHKKDVLENWAWGLKMRGYRNETWETFCILTVSVLVSEFSFSGCYFFYRYTKKASGN